MSIEAGRFHRIREVGRRAAEFAVNNVTKPVTKVRQIHETLGTRNIVMASLYGIGFGFAIGGFIESEMGLGLPVLTVTMGGLLVDAVLISVVGRLTYKKPTLPQE